MTASVLTNLPLAAGSAVAASLGRAGLWAFSHYMKAPLASTGLMAMVTLTAMAGTNALYMQPRQHPAPFFAPEQAATAEIVAPVPAPAPQPAPERLAVVAPLPVTETTGSVAAPQPVIPDAPVGNRDAFAVQKKLTELGLFNGTVDGFYGPMTANAIRAFEERNGLEPTGALTPAMVETILKADAAGRVAAPQAAAEIAPRPAPASIRPEPVPAAPVQIAATQPAPQPVAQPTEQVQVIARLPTLSPVDNAVDAVGSAAALTIDSIVAAVGKTPAAQGSSPRPAMALGSTTQTMPKPVQVASLEPMAAPVAATTPAKPPVQQAAAPAQTNPLAPANDTELVSQIQRGLASLGFYHGSIDGQPGDTTARAIREFENFHSYKLTGEVKPDLVSLLRSAGASI